MTYAGLVLAGGRGRRLGGIAKPEIAVGDRRLLDIAVEALEGADPIVVVGPALTTTLPVTWAREQPPGGGPVAALAAGLALLDAAAVAVLAADLPFVTAAVVRRLVDARGDAAAVIAIDGAGRDQPLLACYETAALQEAMPPDVTNAALRAVTHELAAHGEIRRIDLGGDPPVTWDCDTPLDLMRAKELA